jgi:hypothetical protein
VDQKHKKGAAGRAEQSQLLPCAANMLPHGSPWYFPNDQQPGGEQQSRLITRITNHVFGFSSCSGPLTAQVPFVPMPQASCMSPV